MADKILNTRIKLKYDTYENWSTKNPILLAGEIAIATVPSGDSNVGVLVKDNLPNVVIKVGDGTNAYNDLKFVSGLAADVYEWAKAASKPSYTAGEIGGLAEFISTEIQDTDTQYTLVKSDTADETSYKFKLMSRVKGATAYTTQVAEIDLSNIDTRLDALEAAIGEGGSVSAQIDTKIQALDAAGETAGTGEVISAVSETDGIVTVSKKTLVADDIPTLSIAKISGLQDALDAKEDDLGFDGTYNKDTNKVATVATVTTAIEGLDKADAEVAKQFVTAVAEENGIITVSRRALAAEDIPVISQDQVDGLGTALSEKQDNLAFEGEYNATSNKVATASFVRGLVADLNGAMHFEGVVTGDTFEAAVAASGKTFVAGDVVLYGVDEYVYDGAAWHVLGNEAIYQLKEDSESQHQAINEAIEDLDEAKQDVLGFEGTYNKDTNKVMTKAATATAITEAINAIDVSDAAETGKFVTAVSQADGVISVSREALKATDIPTIAQSQVDGLGDALAAKQNNLEIADTYNAESNKVATVATVTNAINALDYAGGNFAEHKFVTKVTEENGVITAEYAQPSAADVTGLAAIATSGSTDDLVQGTNVLVFDCGNATI